MSKLFNNISDADKKMLTKIYWRSFAVFAGPCGAAYRQAPGFTMSIMPALERFIMVIMIQARSFRLKPL